MSTEELLKYYDAIGDMTPAQLSELWKEETAEQYEEMLGVLPPARWKDNAFMVGERITGNLFDAHIKIDGRYFWRPADIYYFDPANYKREIRAKFSNGD